MSSSATRTICGDGAAVVCCPEGRMMLLAKTPASFAAGSPDSLRNDSSVSRAALEARGITSTTTRHKFSTPMGLGSWATFWSTAYALDGMTESVMPLKNTRSAEDSTAGENWLGGAPWLSAHIAPASVGSLADSENHSATDCFAEPKDAMIPLTTVGRDSDLFRERSKSAGRT